MQVMLAGKLDLEKLVYPVLISPKLDGIRAYVKDGVVLSRTNKPIPNLHIQAKFGHLHGLDGELIMGEPTDKDCFRITTSAVMTIQGEPEVDFFVFDRWDRVDEYKEVDVLGTQIVPSFPVSNTTDLLEWHDQFCADGFEGSMIRTQSAPYKNGRSTVKEQGLLKLKPFDDAEFKVVGFEEHLHGDTLGALVLEYGDTAFKCGTGFTDELRNYIWTNKGDFIGQMATIQYQGIGKDRPRFPSFKGMRNE